MRTTSTLEKMGRRLKRGKVEGGERAKAKATEFGFFLGLDDGWLKVKGKSKAKAKAME